MLRSMSRRALAMPLALAAFGSLLFVTGPADAGLFNGGITFVGSGDTEGLPFDTATQIDFGTLGSGGGNGFGNPGTFSNRKARI